MSIFLAILGLLPNFLALFKHSNPVVEAAVPHIVTAVTNAAVATQSNDLTTIKNNALVALGAAAATGQIVSSGGQAHTMQEIQAAVPEISALIDQVHAAVTTATTQVSASGTVAGTKVAPRE